MLAQKMSNSVDVVLVCLGVLSVRSSGLSLFVTRDRKGGVRNLLMVPSGALREVSRRRIRGRSVQ